MRNVLVGLVALLVVGCTSELTPEDYAELGYERCVERIEQGCSSDIPGICERERENYLESYERNLPAFEVAGCADTLYEALTLEALPEYACTYYQDVPGHEAIKACMLKFAEHCAENRQDSDCVEFCELMPWGDDYLGLVPCD